MTAEKTLDDLGEKLKTIGIEKAEELQQFVEDITQHEIEQRTDAIASEAYDTPKVLQNNFEMLQGNIDDNYEA